MIQKNNAGESDFALTVKGSFSWGITPKLDQADKDKIKEKIKEKSYKLETKEMGKFQKAMHDLLP